MDKKKKIEEELALLEQLEDEEEYVRQTGNGPATAKSLERGAYYNNDRHVFSIPKRAPGALCNARVVDSVTGEERYCQNVAGYMTGYPAGRCLRHGGGKVNRYSHASETVHALVSRFDKDADPLDCTDDIKLLRGLIIDWVEDYDSWAEMLRDWHLSYKDGSQGPAKPDKIMDKVEAYKMLEALSKMVDREQKKRNANAISHQELVRVLTEVGRVIETYVSDEDKLKEIRRGILSIDVKIGANK